MRRRALLFAVYALGLLASFPTSGTAQGTPMPFVRPQFLDNSGNPCNGCLLNAYTAGTTTRQDTFSDITLSSANANPVVMDSAGRPTTGHVFLSATTYRFVLTDSTGGTTYWDHDNAPAIPATAVGFDVASQTAGETLVLNDVVYLSDGSGGTTAGRWYKTDADNTYSSSTAGRIGIATAAIASAATGTIRIGGRVTGLSSLTAGEFYYVSATAGALTATPPTNAWFVGKADTTTSLILGPGEGAVRLPDSDGTHSRVIRTSENLTADYTLNILGGNIAQTFNLSRPKAPGGRCTLTTGTAVTTANVTAATTLYYTPYAGAATPTEITLYDGSASWTTLTLSELSIAVPATTNTMYDVFVDYTAGVPALEVVAWTNDTTRATALATQNTVYVQTSDTDSLYVCSFRTTGVSGQTEDSEAKRYVFNAYNRVMRSMRVIEGTNTWTYTTDTFRQANGAVANQLDFVNGLSEDAVSATLVAAGRNDNSDIRFSVGIGLDSTTAIAAGSLQGYAKAYNVNSEVPLAAQYVGFPGIGRHFLAWLERSVATGTTTWLGDDGGTVMQSGIAGWIRQ